MTSVFEIHDVGGLIAFFAWTLVVMGATRAVFVSFPAAEIRFWAKRRSDIRDASLAKAKWELVHNCIWSAELQRDPNNPHVAKHPLDESGREYRRNMLDQAAKASILRRAFAYGMNCQFCNTATAAMLLFGLTAGWRPAELILSGLAYATAATLTERFRSTEPRPPHAAKSCNH